MVRTLVSARGGAAVVGIVIGLGATSVAAYSATRVPGAPTSTGVVAAAPTTTPSPKASDRPVGPDATGPAAFGLCRAWTNHQKHADGKDRAKDSVAMRNLAQAAGGEDRIGAYCATVAHPGTGVKGGDGKGNGKGQDKAAKAEDKAAKDAAKAKEKAARDAAKAKEKQDEAATPGPKGSTAPSPAPSVAPSIAPSVPVFPSPSVTPTP